MSKFGLYSDKSSEPIQFESHLEGLKEEIKTLLLSLRNFVKSLSNNILEEIRPHRIVYAKTLTFRTFLDIQPRNDSLMISVKKGRTEPPTMHIIRTPQELEHIEFEITEAYKRIK
jgi:hypothetical protein